MEPVSRLVPCHQEAKGVDGLGNEETGRGAEGARSVGRIEPGSGTAS